MKLIQQYVRGCVHVQIRNQFSEQDCYYLVDHVLNRLWGKIDGRVRNQVWDQILDELDEIT